MPDPKDELAQALADLAGGGTSRQNDQLVPPGRRPCPICGQHMQVEAVEGVGVDVCPQHGVWLDNAELSSIIYNSSVSVTPADVAAVHRARSEGKMAGAILGVWSFLLP